MKTTRSKAENLSLFAADLTWADIPPAVREQAKLQILDAVGTGIAATAYPFAQKAVAGVNALGGNGACSVIGQGTQLSARDAALDSDHEAALACGQGA